MKSMTAFAEHIHPLQTGRLRFTLRSVNGKGLDLNLRLPLPLYALEPILRGVLREQAQRGKLDLTLEVQDEPSLEPRMNRALLRTMAKAWTEDAEWLNLPPLSAEAFFRLPGAWLPPEGGVAERLEADVVEGLKALLHQWNGARIAEAERLRPFFQDSLERLLGLRSLLQAEAEAQAVELPEMYRARLDQVLRDAHLQGQLPEERVVAEAGALAERQDVREELVRLQSHLEDFGERLRKNQLGGRGVDVWCQEVLRELNTCGSKCKRLAMTRTVMEAKGVLDQIREQGANLE